MEAIAHYSTSVEDLETIDYFLDLHGNKEVPRKIQNPVIDFLVLEQEVQSKSTNAFRCRGESDRKNKPCLGTNSM